jgi:hypothetical protein
MLRLDRRSQPYPNPFSACLPVSSQRFAFPHLSAAPGMQRAREQARRLYQSRPRTFPGVPGPPARYQSPFASRGTRSTSRNHISRAPPLKIPRMSRRGHLWQLPGQVNARGSCRHSPARISTGHRHDMKWFLRKRPGVSGAPLRLPGTAGPGKVEHTTDAVLSLRPGPRDQNGSALRSIVRQSGGLKSRRLEFIHFRRMARGGTYQ